MIWFDIDNSPHVPLFRPILAELDRRGIEYLVTARNFAQTIDLLKYWNMPHYPVGIHGGRVKIKKIANILHRSLQLRRFCKDKRVTLAVSHGSRSQLIAAKLMGIRSVLMLDYEYTESRIFNRFASCLLIPEYIPDERLLSAGFNLKKIIRYKGFKEELYLSSFIPDPLFREKINVPDSSILIVFRPPGMTSNYHDNRSEQLLISALKYFSSFNNTLCLIINRGDTEKKYILSKIRPKHNIRFQQKAVDGLQLLYTADIAVSGGGTMNRESALLGTRTYSIFTGRRPYLDEYLQHLGKLNFIESDRDIEKIAVKKHLNKEKLGYNGNLVGDVVHFILDINRVN